MDYYSLGKTVHFIGLISWFAGLFYLPRLFIYHVEALEKTEPEKSILANQFGLMEKRLYNIIMNPAMVLTYIGGFTMIFTMIIHQGWDWFTIYIWLHIKLGFVFLLTVYHFYSKGIIRKLSLGKIPMSSNQLRYYNEIATVILLAIVLLAVFKSRLDFIYAFVSIIIFVLLLVLGIRLYRRLRG